MVESSAVGGWSEALGALHERIGHRFARSEARERVRRYLFGLLGQVERKNGWRLAEAVGERDPQGVQRLLNSAKWDADEVRDDLGEYVVEHLGDEGTGILIVDETGFLKKGQKSVGVARQYTGTAGDTINCQVGVFLAYASKKGAAFVDRALYLPKGWTSDPVRRAEAGVPEGIAFRNKIELRPACFSTFVDVLKTAYLRRIVEPRVSRRLPLFTPVTVTVTVKNLRNRLLVSKTIRPQIVCR